MWRMIDCPHCHHELTEAQIRSLNGKLNSSKRTRKAGGRPRAAEQQQRPGEWITVRLPIPERVLVPIDEC
jgi:hypothetical protein